MMPEYSDRYMLSDSRNEPLAAAFLETPPDAAIWRLRLKSEDLLNVLEHEEINLISIDEGRPEMIGRILSSNHTDTIEVEPLNEAGKRLRQNLRVPVRFESFLYPITGSWTGRLPIVCHDLSCGGIAFFCNFPLNLAEIAEVVVPITSQPLILRAQILRLRPSNSNIPLYAAGFVDLLHDEEVILREAIFSQQISNRDARK
mgnify:CR=1 FL=1